MWDVKDAKEIYIAPNGSITFEKPIKVDKSFGCLEYFDRGANWKGVSIRHYKDINNVWFETLDGAMGRGSAPIKSIKPDGNYSIEITGERNFLKIIPGEEASK